MEGHRLKIYHFGFLRKERQGAGLGGIMHLDRVDRRDGGAKR